MFSLRILETDIRAEMARLRAAVEAAGHELSLEDRLNLRDDALENLVERELITSETQRLKLKTTDDLVLHWGRNIKTPSRTEIQEFYRQNHDRFWRPESIHASHFVKNHEGADREQNRTCLNEIRDRVIAGENINILAAQHSDCPEKAGDLGYFARGVMVREFEEVVFAAPLRQVTPVFETPFGFHIAEVHDRLPEGFLTVNEASPRISEELYRSKLDQEIGKRLDDLMARAQIEIV